MPPVRRAPTALRTLALATLFACGGADVPDAVPPDAAPPVAAPPVAAPASAASGDTVAFAGTTAPTTVARPGAVATLVAVRTGAQAGGGERVVLEFAEDSLPGHAIAYEDDPRACGSGERVRVAGAARLVVRLEPARAHTDAGESTIAARRLAPGGAIVRELVASCDFEATVAWVIGLDRRRPYRVLTLASPARLVVDVGG